MIEIAHIVRNAAAELGMEVSIDHIQNPRAEKEEHYYNPIRRVLPSLGMFGLRKDFRSEVKVMLQDIIPYRHRIEEKRSIIMPECGGGRVGGARRDVLVIAAYRMLLNLAGLLLPLSSPMDPSIWVSLNYGTLAAGGAWWGGIYLASGGPPRRLCSP